MPTSPLSSRETDALLRYALDMFDEIASLLEALAPIEIHRAAANMSRKGVSYEHAFWGIYERRHRVFTAAFGQQRSAFAQRARGHFGSREPHAGDPCEGQVPSSH
jgi:hypothetical protein